MYRSFRIKNFRCFKVLSIDNLERVNLIAGANNVGKTALLEAIFLHSGATRIGLTLRLNSFRGYEQLKVDEEDAPQNIWGPLFYRYDDKTVIKIQANDSDDEIRTLRMKFIQPDSATIQLNPSVQRESLEEGSMLSTESIHSGLELEQEFGNGKRKTFQAIIDLNGIKLHPRPDPVLFPCHFFAARMRSDAFQEVERYGNLVVENQEHTIVDFLKIIEPRLKWLLPH